MFRRVVLAVLLVCLTPLAYGCSSPTGPCPGGVCRQFQSAIGFYGTVTTGDGQPVRNAAIYYCTWPRSHCNERPLSESRSWHEYAVSDSTGRYEVSYSVACEFAGDGDRFHLRARATGYADSETVDARCTPGRDRETHRVDFVLQPLPG